MSFSFYLVFFSRDENRKERENLVCSVGVKASKKGNETRRVNDGGGDSHSAKGIYMMFYVCLWVCLYEREKKEINSFVSN